MTFDKFFRLLTGNDPFPWQQALYHRFSQGEIPVAAALPTGLGKTAVIAIWLIALANHPRIIPRRLVYVVNRRTVVDQTTDEVEKLRRNLAAAGLINNLNNLCALDCDCPLAISTLRGQFADNREWSADPCRPAVIVGTVDMIGSRLLFGGYGIGFRTKPLHAGFLGQDTLIIHDEAHLEPAFQHLLVRIAAEQERCGDVKRMRLMQLTATSRDGEAAFELTAADERHIEVSKRLNAHKELCLHPVDDPKRVPEKLIELASAYKESERAVIIFTQTVETVERIAAALQKLVGPTKVERLTGTLRGRERDGLVKKPVFLRFLTGNGEPGTVFLVCTSAGEVGVNISADDLVCDLSTFDSMAQRFGRVNRFGQRKDAKVDVVHPTEFADEQVEIARGNTLELLHKLNGDASPQALRSLDPQKRMAAFRPSPDFVPVSDILFDAWSLSSIAGRLQGRPSLEPFLHGASEAEVPETFVAWREEVEVVKGELLDVHEPAALLEEFPLKPHEMLRDRSDRVFKHLVSLSKRDENAGLPVWLVLPNAEIKASVTLGTIANGDKEDIAHCIVLLPPCAGGLSGGFLDGGASSSGNEDVSGDWFDEDRNPRRTRVWDVDAETEAKTAGMRLLRQIDTKPAAEEIEVDETELGPRLWRWYERPGKADSEGSKSAKSAVLLDDHAADVEKNARTIAGKLELSQAVKEALILAARFHDAGKRREQWQRSIGNMEGGVWLAKSGKNKFAFRIADENYRHEFGSIHDAFAHPEITKLPDETRDLLLHFIAAHHGRGRPHFAVDEVFDSYYDRAAVNRVAAEIPRRFARLQRRNGRWGLAYLESLLRAADYAASANPTKIAEVTQ